jgi:hypothetical protein
MGLLDDLKRQADMARTHDSLQKSVREENVRAVDEAMHRTFFYLLDLFKQLAVLKPVSPIVYSMSGIGELRNLQFTDSFVDGRKKRFGEREAYDYVDFWLTWSAPGSLVVERDLPQAIAKVRDMLWAYNIKFTEEEKRNEQRSVVKVIFTIPKSLNVDFTLKADHENRKLLFYGKNALRLGMDDFAVPADEMTEAVVEELAKVLIAQPSEFTRKYRTVLKRA